MYCVSVLRLCLLFHRYMQVIYLVQTFSMFKWFDEVGKQKLYPFVTSHAWKIIYVLIGLFFIPYFIPHASIIELGSYAALSAVPVSVAALLKHRRGSIIASAVLMAGLAVFNAFQFGLSWPQDLLVSWFSGGLGIFIYGFAVGQFSLMRKELAKSHKETEAAHNELLMQHHALMNAYEEVKTIEEEMREVSEAALEANEQLTEMALKDPLTGVYNHRTIYDILQQNCIDSTYFQRPCAVLFFDLDHFKALNDGYGHTVGDQVLKELAELLRENLRMGDNVGRWGGEEFIIILPETDSEAALVIAERIREKVVQHPFTETGSICMTCSIGVAEYPLNGETAADVLNAADQAMYVAKKTGRNKVLSSLDPEVTLYTMHTDKTESRDETLLQGVIIALNALLALRDTDTGSHTSRVSELVYKIAIAMGLNESESRMAAVAGQLHDIGKIGVPDAILLKPGKLTEAEWAIMKLHPQYGEKIIRTIPTLNTIAGAVRSHHERWDGDGYPDKLSDETIPLVARIIAVVDSYDAMISDRPYRKAQTSEFALKEIMNCAGSQFDPKVVEALRSVLRTEIPQLEEAA